MKWKCKTKDCDRAPGPTGYCCGLCGELGEHSANCDSDFAAVLMLRGLEHGRSENGKN